MIQILRVWCQYFFRLVGQILNRCFSKFLPVYETHRVQLSLYDGGAIDNHINHRQHTRRRLCRRGDAVFYEPESTDEPNFFTQHVVEEPFQESYVESSRRLNEVTQRLLRNDHVCNEFLAFESKMAIASFSSEFEDAEDMANVESYHDPSEDTSDSSISEISKVLQSVMTTIQNMQKAPESLDVSAESSAILTDSVNVPFDWVVDSFHTIPDENDEHTSRTTDSLKITAESTRGILTESLSTTVLTRNLDDESLPEVILRTAPHLQDVESYTMGAETLQNAAEFTDSNFSESIELTLKNESIPINSREAILENSTDSLPMTTESNYPTLQNQTGSPQELTENSKPSLENGTESLTRAESRESTSERSESSRVSDILPQSSSFITFKGAINKYLYMPQLVAATFGIKESARDWDVNWTHDFVSFRTCRKLKGHQRINHFPGSICLSNKDLLGRNLNVMYECFPCDYDIFPKTWLIPGDMPKIERYVRNNKRASFIVKPHDGGAGSGIKITSSLREINSRRKIVCQLYIQRPFLIDGYKFDFRVYVLMTSIEPLRIFVHKEGLARFATVKYEKPSASNSMKKFMHLTNTCVNKNNPAYIRDESKGSTRRITSVFQWFVDNSIDAGKVQDSMDDTIIKTIIVCLPTLQHYYHLSFPYHTTSISCFELMGFDIMIDHKLKVYLLEVNVAPSFANETGTSHVACIKQEVVRDTFKILNLMETEKIQKHKAEKRAKIINAGKIKDRLITNRRIQWENSHMGNFRKIYPPAAIRRAYYQKFIDKAISNLRPNYNLNSREIELTAEQRKWLT